MPYDLTGRTAVVTGAGSGIGRAYAVALAGAGAHVVCADIDGAAASATAVSIGAAGGIGTAAAVDVASRTQVEGVVEAAHTETGRLDVMCNIAGISHLSTVLETTDDDLDRVWSVNFKGVFYGCQATARVMVAHGGGSIVNMASNAVDQPMAGLLCYTLSKVGVVQLTRNLALELGPQGVRVNAIAPGLIVTAMTARAYTDASGHEDPERREVFLDTMRARSPLHEVGEPDDIAAAALYLASDASKFVTGHTLRVNGGTAMV